VDGENEQKLEESFGDGHSATSLTPADSIAIRRALTRLLRRRLKRFMVLAPEIRMDAHPKTIHDIRVWSRRLQQAISALFPKPRSGKVRRLRRTPRRVRRALGEWRNCDVLLDLVARQQRRTQSEAKRRAWGFVHDYLLRKRAKEAGRAEKKLQFANLADYGALAQRLLGHMPEEAPEVLMRRLSESVEEGWTKWQSALSRAQETRALGDLHAFRVATKTLRYRTELLYDLGDQRLKGQLKCLAGLQNVLGVWHDRQVLAHAVAEAIAGVETLLSELPTARLLLGAVQAQRNRDAQYVEKIFRLAGEHSGSLQTQTWTEKSLVPQAQPLT